MNSRPQPYQGCALPLSYGSTFRGKRAYDGAARALSTRLAGIERDAHLGGMAEKDKEREERLAAALRENLRRRKAQSRELGEGEEQEKPES